VVDWFGRTDASFLIRSDLIFTKVREGCQNTRLMRPLKLDLRLLDIDGKVERRAPWYPNSGGGSSPTGR
jgi:hypothetical protein